MDNRQLLLRGLPKIDELLLDEQLVFFMESTPRSVVVDAAREIIDELRRDEVLCRELNIGIAHFRHVYKNFFGISFNQDCIASRAALAKFLLFTTSFDVNTIAAKCGYSDEKYFMRLFQKNTSFTPSQYRKLFYLNV